MQVTNFEKRHERYDPRRMVSPFLKISLIVALVIVSIWFQRTVRSSEIFSGSEIGLHQKNVASPDGGLCSAANNEGCREDSVPSRSGAYVGNSVEDGVTNSLGQRSLDNKVDVSFTLHPNGNGLDEGVRIASSDFNQIDDVISKYCCDLMQMDQSRCEPNSGARLLTEVGVRMLSFNDVEEGQRVYCVPQAVHFVWPMKHTGQVVYPKNVKGPIEGKPIKLKQLSEQIRVFSVDNFVSPSEVEEILKVNRNRMTPSEVGFGGWQDDTRTSSTSWDSTSKASIAIQKRTFEILGMDYEPDVADTLQVLRYTSDGHKGHGQWYKPHVDWFSADGYDGSVPKENNGSNRFATMFLYLSTVEEGGATVFPLSTTHEGYNGEKLVHDGTINTPGYIDTTEARYCCNETSTALRSKPIQGNAVLFYSQGPDGTLDPWSLHGGCPPIKGDKWSANVWIWNRKRPDKSLAKDLPKGAKAKPDAKSLVVTFYNRRPGPVHLRWDANAPVEGFDDLDDFTEMYRSDLEIGSPRFKDQGVIQPGAKGLVVNSYLGHVFVGVDQADNNKVVFVGVVKEVKDLAKEEFNGDSQLFYIN